MAAMPFLFPLCQTANLHLLNEKLKPLQTKPPRLGKKKLLYLHNTYVKHW